MDTKESNKLIADFQRIWLPAECLRYHSSWDWLMPVVKKIVPPHGWHLPLVKYQTAIVDSLQTAKIEEVYEAVVEFIKQHSLIVK